MNEVLIEGKGINWLRGSGGEWVAVRDKPNSGAGQSPTRLPTSYAPGLFNRSYRCGTPLLEPGAWNLALTFPGPFLKSRTSFIVRLTSIDLMTGSRGDSWLH